MRNLSISTLLLVCLLFMLLRLEQVEAQDDANTLLLLHFENSLIGTQGETPTQATGYSFQPGISGTGISLPTGNQLFYTSTGNISASEGTLETWIKPNWNGNDNQSHTILMYGGGGGILIIKDGANNLRIIANRFGAGGNPEVGVAFNVGSWLINEWHHIAFTWSSSGKAVKIYIDGSLRGTSTFTFNLPAINSTTFQIGADGSGNYLNSTIDELRISDKERTATEIAQSSLAPLTIVSLTVQPNNIQMLQTWYKTPTLTAQTNLGTRQVPNAAATWVSSNSSVATVNTLGRITGVSIQPWLALDLTLAIFAVLGVLARTFLLIQHLKA